MKESATPTTQPNFDTYLHGLRGVAAFAVFLGHSMHGTAEIWAKGTPAEGVAQAINRLGTTGVEFFFILSGFLIAASIQRYPVRKYLSLRATRVYPLFMVVTLLYYAMNSILKIKVGLSLPSILAANLGLYGIVAGFPTLSPNSWTVMYEMYYYVLAIPAIKLISTPNLLLRYLGWLPLLAFTGLFPVTLYFLAGLGYRGLSKKPELLAKLSMPKICPVFVLIYLACGASYDPAYTWPEFADLRVVGLFVSVNLLFLNILNRNPLFDFLTHRSWQSLGTISYSLYLLHPYPYFAMRTLFLKLAPGPAWVSAPAFLILTFALTLVVSQISFKLIEEKLYWQLRGKG